MEQDGACCMTKALGTIYSLQWPLTLFPDVPRLTISSCLQGLPVAHAEAQQSPRTVIAALREALAIKELVIAQLTQEKLQAETDYGRKVGQPWIHADACSLQQPTVYPLCRFESLSSACRAFSP